MNREYHESKENESNIYELSVDERLPTFDQLVRDILLEIHKLNINESDETTECDANVDEIDVYEESDEGS